LKNGISTTGKIALFTVIAPYVLLTIMLFKVLQMEGSVSGIKFLFTPDMSKLFTLKIWSEAINQCFFQYGVGMGANITFAQFRPTKKKVYKGAFFICIANMLSSILGS
jgi:SNF family Na+-dependent transporter